MSLAHERFIALDWSGARVANGIAVAECTAGEEAPQLVLPPQRARRWTRSMALEWLGERLSGPERALVGIDCAFSLPFARAGAYFQAPEQAHVFALWELVEARSGGAPDFYGGAFAAHPAHAADYWARGPRPGSWSSEPHRATEQVCRAEGLGTPDSPFKLIGAKQVGKGALAGMRVLRALRARLGARVAVWPFEEPRPTASTVVELYPRLFLMRAGYGTRKIRAWEDLDAALSRLGSRPLAERGTRAPSDHEADALVSAAGLRSLARDARVWAPAGLGERARRQEGWIFGVGLGRQP